MIADGSNGSIELCDYHIVIRRKGIANSLKQGLQGVKTIPLSSITAVHLRPARSIMAGLIQFTLAGGQDRRGGMPEATKYDNAVTFKKAQEVQILALRDAVQQAILKLSAVESASVTNLADELTKLADLVEKGYLTRDEFDDQKQALLQQSASAEAALDPRLIEPNATACSPVNVMSPEVSNGEDDEPVRGFHPLAIGCFVIVIAFVILVEVLANLA